MAQPDVAIREAVLGVESPSVVLDHPCGVVAGLPRPVEAVIAAIALILALPVLAFCALVVKLSGDGPIVLAQTRVGKDGRLFKMYKLRTMWDNCETNGAVWASDDDPRVIPVCRWMRISHVDELPQLVNVILGQMSLVGPRPERQGILSDLRTLYPNVDSRLAVRPGITGSAQVRLGYDTTPAQFRRKLNVDLEYIRTRSPWLDLRIILQTLPKFFDHQAT